MYHVKIPTPIARALVVIFPLAFVLMLIVAHLITQAEPSPLELEPLVFAQYITFYSLIFAATLMAATIVVGDNMPNEVLPGDKAVLRTSEDLEADIATLVATPSGPQIHLNVNGVTVPHTHEQLVVLTADGVNVTDEFCKLDLIATVDHLRVDTYDVGGFALPLKWTVTVATIGLTKDQLKPQP